MICELRCNHCECFGGSWSRECALFLFLFFCPRSFFHVCFFFLFSISPFSGGGRGLSFLLLSFGVEEEVWWGAGKDFCGWVSHPGQLL